MTDYPDNPLPAEAAVVFARRFVEQVLTEAADRGDLASGTVPEVIGVRAELLAMLALALGHNDSELLERRNASRH